MYTIISVINLSYGKNKENTTSIVIGTRIQLQFEYNGFHDKPLNHSPYNNLINYLHITNLIII